MQYRQKHAKGFLSHPLIRSRLSRWQLYVMLFPALAFILIFAYKPMYGVIIAFKDYKFSLGIMGSEWVGFENFSRLFNSYWFPIILKNTLSISLLSLFLGFPVPIILALMVNEIEKKRLKGFFQTVSYAPHFISVIVVCGMAVMFLSPTSGIINKMLGWFNVEPIFFIQKPTMFKWIYVFSGIWQNTGWGAIIYYAALSGVDGALLEAADIDGASRLQRIWHINLPALIPTIVILFILSCGRIMSVGYEKVYALQNSLNLKGSEVISTYVFKVGLVNGDFSFSTATGLFDSVVNSSILVLANFASRRLTQIGLW